MKRSECELTCTTEVISGLVHSYLAFGKTKEALYTAREAMNAMPQSAKALKLVGDVHANTSSGREKVKTGSFMLRWILAIFITSIIYP